MEDIKIEVSAREITELLKEKIVGKIQESLRLNTKQIEDSVEQYFRKSIFDNKITHFESALDWAVENCFREGLNLAMEELGYKEMIATKAKELLSDNNFIAELAEAKVRASLGLPSKKVVE